MKLYRPLESSNWNFESKIIRTTFLWISVKFLFRRISLVRLELCERIEEAEGPADDILTDIEEI